MANNDPCIKHCRKTIERLHPDDFHKINDVAYSSGNILWVHLTHPSKGNGTIKSWLTSGKGNKPGLKRELAIEALESINSPITSNVAYSDGSKNDFPGGEI